MLEKTLRFANKGPILTDLLISKEKYEQLMKYYQIEREQELLDLLDIDFYYLSGRDISQNEGYLKYYKHSTEMTETHRICPLGIRWQRQAGDSKFSVDEAIEGPFQKSAITEKDILSFRWPKPSDFDFSSMLQEWEENQERIIIGGLWTGLMGDSYRMMGFENFLINTALQPHLIKTLINRMAEMYFSLNDAVFTVLKGKLDIWYFGNDFGTQNGLLLSPEMIEEYFFEPIKSMCSLAKSYGIHVMMHSCGAISSIIPMLYRAGVEIIDPIQVTAKQMDPESLARDYGGKIVFHGGVDTQNVLPNASPDQVKEHATFVANTFVGTGGYIFASSQILDKDIPDENVVAMYDAMKEKNKLIEEEKE